jgi:hypothetical protein
VKDKVQVYVSSFEISTLDYVDKASMGHPCVTARHGKNIFTGLKHLPKGLLDGYLTDDQLKTVDVVDQFCKTNGLQYEIVNMTNLGWLRKMKLVFKGIKAPTTIFRGRRIEGPPARKDLEALISETT